jgi:hypothetical protein
VFVSTSASFGLLLSSVLSAAVCAAALLAWYGLGAGLRARWRGGDKGVTVEREKTPLHGKIEHMLTEARVILPGTQAMLGFQLVVMMTDKFEKLPPDARIVHLVALASLILAIILLICPAAIHRIAFHGMDDPRMHNAGSILITAALLPFAVGISCDLWVALTILFGEGMSTLAGSVAAFALLMVLWFLLPLLIRRRAAGGAVAVRH